MFTTLRDCFEPIGRALSLLFSIISLSQVFTLRKSVFALLSGLFASLYVSLNGYSLGYAASSMFLVRLAGSSLGLGERGDPVFV